MPKLTSETLTGKKIWNAIERGWKKADWTRGSFFRLKNGNAAYSEMREGSLVILNLRGDCKVSRPCACAIGAFAIDQNITPADAIFMIERAKLDVDPNGIVMINDRAENFTEAKRNLRKFLLG